MKAERGKRASRHVVRNARGQVTVLFALILPMLLVMGAVVLDIGNLYVHKKHNQTLVDAGAFAGGTKFVGCSFQFGDPDAANAAIRATALQYAGDTTRSPGTYNLQVQHPDNVHVVLNSARYWDQGDRTDGVGFDDTLDTDGNPLTPGDPCSTRTLDVKATDHDPPLLWGIFPFRPDPKSKARIEIRQIKEQAGMLPWAVPEVEPAAVAAIFVNENTGNVLASQLLMKQDDPALPFSEWKTSPTDSTVDLANENTGVVILVSKVDDTPTLGTGGPGTLGTICSQSPGLVSCHGGSGNQSGLTFIHGWSDAAGTPANPQIRDFNVLSVTCNDDLSYPYFLRAGDCDLGARAVIDFGVLGDPTRNPPSGVGARVKLNAPGCGGQGCTMSYAGQGASPTESIWFASSAATLGTSFGRSTFSLSWSTEFPDRSNHSGTFPGVAHPYVADDHSGSIDYLKLSTTDPGIPDANSRNSGPPVHILVTVGLRKPLALQDPLAAPMVLRIASPSGSQNQAFDCDKHNNFQVEITNGCETTYGLNYDDWSSPRNGTKEWADILCNGYGVGDLPPDSTANNPAPICVAVETGDKIGQFRQGLTHRFETPDCHPNNWPKDQGAPGHGPEDDDAIHDFFTTYDFANDPRYVTLIITDDGTFQSSGNDQVPVKYFAGFYVTGWDVNGNVKPCLDNDPHPWYGSTYRKSLDNGDVWGHFVNIVVFSSSGAANDDLCNFDEVGNCIPILVE